MSTVFIIIVVFAFAHFIYEAILAPSRKLELRCAIFEQRDRLRELAIEHPDDIDKEAFHSIHDTVNTAIKTVPMITASALVGVSRAVKSDAKLRRYIERRNRVINESRLPELKEISDATAKAGFDAFIANSAFLVLWVVPALLALAWIAIAVRNLLSIPPHRLDRLIADERHLAI